MWLDALSIQRSRYAEVGEQHLTQLGKDRLLLAGSADGQRHIAQRKSHHLPAVVLPGDNGHQRRHCRHNGMPRLLCKPVSIAGGAGLGIAHAAGCHSHPAGINFASILTDYTPDPGFVKEQLFCLPLPEFGAAALYIPVQGIDNVRCPVTHRERPGFHAQS